MLFRELESSGLGHPDAGTVRQLACDQFPGADVLPVFLGGELGQPQGAIGIDGVTSCRIVGAT